MRRLITGAEAVLLLAGVIGLLVPGDRRWSVDQRTVSLDVIRSRTVRSASSSA